MTLDKKIQQENQYLYELLLRKLVNFGHEVRTFQHENVERLALETLGEIMKEIEERDDYIDMIKTVETK